jgi:PAS domain-containing protein
MTSPATHFAPAKQTSLRTINRQSRYFTDASPLLRTALNGVPDLVAILNKKRQIIYANKNWVKYLLPEIQKVTGMRPGEAINCIHAHEMEGAVVQPNRAPDAGLH